MNKIFIIALIIAIACAESNLQDKRQKEKDFLDLSKKHNKKYASNEETLYRFSVFKDNLKKIDELRKKHKDAQFAVNRMFDLTQEEFMEYFNGARPDDEGNQSDKPRFLESNRMLYTYPSSLDLRSTGGIGSVRDQGNCGSCYVFSSVAALEYATWKSQSQLYDFSEQQLVDCGYSLIPNYPYGGCIGGWMKDMYNYIKVKGLTLESYYPYQAQQKTCNDAAVPKQIYTANPAYVTIGLSDDAIKQALYDIGVLSACVDATDWSFYSSGIFSDSLFSTTAPKCNHAIGIVGYGVENSIPYYIVRNSWNASWGESGYIRLDGRRYSNGYSYGGIVYKYNQYPILL